MAALKFKTLRTEFVTHFLDTLDEGVLYISEEYASAGHRCCCGCGEEVITPLNAAQWSLQKSTSGVTLFPSIGNWKFACQSHYWIRNNRVIDAGPLSSAAIEKVKKRDRRDKDRYVEHMNASVHQPSVLKRLVNWLLGR